MSRIIVGITGASGAILGERLIKYLLEAGNEVDAILSPSAVVVFREELGIRLGEKHSQIRKNLLKHYGNPKGLHVSPADDFAPRLMLPLSLSWDHRVIDGATAARFNVYFASLLADFRRIVL